MFYPTAIFAFLATIILVSNAGTESTVLAVTISAKNGTNYSVIAAGVYQILSVDIFQTTVNTSTSGPGSLTTREEVDVVVAGSMPGALPVTCNMSWLTVFTSYPAIIPLSCQDPAVNVTLVQGEVWPEYGGFYLFVELNGENPAAWKVGSHLSSAPGWNYEPLTSERWPPAGRWTWSGEQMIDQMPTLSLARWISFNSTDP